MTWLEAVILGLVQGLTEFLPISSSAHLRIVGDLMGADPGAAFTAITQIGTEAAVVLFFRRDIARIIKAWFGALPVGPWKNTVPRTNPDARMGWFVIVGSVPIVVLGVLFQNAIDTTFRNLWITVVTLSVFAVLLGIADATSRRTKLLDHMTWRDAVLFGFAQALALIPGVSRSGGTITAGLLMGYTREAAARYSFLLAIPAVLGSGFYKLFTDGLEGGVDPGPTLLATLVAFVVGYVVIVWFLKLVSTHSYLPFVIYRLALAAVVVVLLLTGAVEATSAATSLG
ncbi:undecaprenyl-diphosphate phosphatase [Georgenia thermotolerans]|uniref:Undecaprenyl-diphosphatase n=1 Tax=Georgenia thermotolerans TaxID=527326 RepID=A0A7J5UQT4_9MICO|nr:undecaprenyl-diphosphate phosphatase [Georgenia thermotolerans]KAE8764699.1 undecaprenyl-diphosphate phosphatase [Georgenia thermotolerans]